MTRLAILTSHPIQYYAPLFRQLAQRVDLVVHFAHKASGEDQARAGYGAAFEWDVDLTSGYESTFLTNVARHPGTGHFWGCDTPEVGARLRAGGFSDVLITGWHLKSYIQGLMAAKRLRLPVFVRGDSHLDTPRSSLKRAAKALAYPPFLHLFDAVLYVGERSRQYYRHYGYPADRMVFSPHCVDTGWFADRSTAKAGERLRDECGIGRDARVLLFAGRMVPFKRPFDVIEAAARCRAQGVAVEVMVAGDGELRDDVEMRAAQLQVPIHMLGFCNQSRMPSVYAASDALVLSSDGNETWGLVANEAIACGRPVVVSTACGCAPDLAGTQAAASYPVGDVSALADVLAAMLHKPYPAVALAEFSRRHSLDAAASGIEFALETTKKDRKPRSR